MRYMKKIGHIMARYLPLFAFLSVGSAFGFDRTMYPYSVPSNAVAGCEAMECEIAMDGSELELGKWYTNFEVCRKYADDNGIPLVAVWSNKESSPSWYFDVCLKNEAFKEFQKTDDAGRVIYCFMAGGSDVIDQAGSTAYKWMRANRNESLSRLPLVVLWWEAGGVDVRTSGDEMRGGLGRSDKYEDASTAKVIARISSAFENWSPPKAPSYMGGMFGVSESDGHRLEVESSSTNCVFPLVRTAAAGKVATNAWLKVVGPDEKELGRLIVDWAAGQTNQSVRVDFVERDVVLASSSNSIGIASFGAKDGDRLTLYMCDAEGRAWDTNHVTYVSRPVSAHNPLWPGERGASADGSDAPAALAFGEWTMDLSCATQMVAASSSPNACTLVYVTGSLWDANGKKTFDNFLSLTDASGRNRFDAWAAERSVALVSIDVPCFTNVAGLSERPTLLMREKRDGASGLGYLSRKGASDAAAAAVLARNHALVAMPTAEGGFARVEDGRANGMDVPAFVMLRRDGTVAARLTRFQESPPSDANARESLMRRFDEMVAMARMDGGHGEDVENNDAMTTREEFSPAGGSAKGEISHVDAVDVFKLLGGMGGMEQRVVVRGGSAEPAVSVELLRIASGTNVAQSVVARAAGALSDGIVLTNLLTEAGDYYLRVSADVSRDDGALGLLSAKADNFVAYEIASEILCHVPSDVAATGGVPAEPNAVVVVRVEKGRTYRFTGVDDSEIDALNATNVFEVAVVDGGTNYVAKVSGDVRLKVVDAAEFSHQLWNPGCVGFAEESRTVSERAGAVFIPLERTKGSSGAVCVRVALDEARTSHCDSDGKARFKPFEPVDVVWREGESHVTNVVVELLDDNRYDGPGKVALNLSYGAGTAADFELAATNFAMAVEEDEDQVAGAAAFVASDPLFIEKNAVHAKRSGSVSVGIGRVGGSDGAVSVMLASDSPGVRFMGDVDPETGVVSWANRADGLKTVVVTNLFSVDGAVTLTLSDPANGLSVMAASNSVRIVTVSDNALEFAAPTDDIALYRHIAASNSFSIVGDAVAGRRIVPRLVSGKLPAGLKAVYDKYAHALVVHGVPTARAGAYTAVYRVDNGSVKGLARRLAFTVADPLDVAGSPETANRSIAKSRTFRDVPVIDEESGRLRGTLQVTIPTRGKASARYLGADGRISLAARGWSAFDAETRELRARLTSKKDHALDLVVADDGGVSMELHDAARNASYVAAVDGSSLWSRTNTAEAWKGLYTVALPTMADSVEETRSGFAPRGTGYLTLRMNSSGAYAAGRMTWAGMLPNGTTLSGATALTRRDAAAEGESPTALLPVFTVSTTDSLAALLQIGADGLHAADARGVQSAANVEAHWVHRERTAAAQADYSVGLDVRGGVFDAGRALDQCYEEFYPGSAEAVPLRFVADWLESESHGALEADAATMSIAKAGLKLVDAPKGMTLSFNRATGVVSGKVRFRYGDGSSLSAAWRGVLLQGLGANGVADDGVARPFIDGSFFFKEKISYEAAGSSGRVVTKSLSVRRGGEVYAE